MENNLFERNLEIIKKYNLDVYNYVIDNMEEVELANVLNKEKSLAEESYSYSIEVENQVYHLDSKYMPNGIANVWAEAQGELKEGHIAILFGLGSGKYFSAIRNNMSGNVLCMVYEPNKQLFLNSLKEIDYAEFPECFHIIVDGINEVMFPQYLIHYVQIYNRDFLRWAIHPNYANMYPEKIAECKAKISSRMLDLVSESNIGRLYAGKMTLNGIMAMKYFSECSLLDQIESISGKDFDEDIPVIIVSAGPSLKKNISLLKKAKNKALILATDTALKTLNEEGIKPDAYVIVDCHKSLRKFQNEYAVNTTMITLETANANVLDLAKGKKIFMNNSLGYGGKIFQEFGKRYDINASGGSVATVCYVIAKRMGFKKIILIGQDLAYTENKRYADAGFKVRGMDIDNEEDKDMFLEVEDIYGNPIKTSYDFKMYIDWFEANIAYDKDINVWDATEGGAKIEGTIIDTLENVINNECKVEFDFENYMKNIPQAFDEEEKVVLKEKLLEFPTKIQAIREKALEGIELYKKMVDMVDSQNIDGAKLQEISDKVSEIVIYFENSGEYQIISNLCMHIENEIISDMLKDNGDDENDLRVLANKGIAMMEATEQGVDEVLGIFRDEVLPTVMEEA